MKRLAAFFLFVVLISRAYGQDTEETMITPKPHLSDAHHIGWRVGFVAGLDNIQAKTTNGKYKRSMVPGFSAGMYYRYQRKHLILMPEFSFSRQGGSYSIKGADYSIPGSTIMVDNKVSYAFYNFNLKAFVGAKVKGFMFYGGPLMAVQMSGHINANATYTSPANLSSITNEPLTRFSRVLPELAVGVGYDLTIGKNKKRGITFDVQFSHSVIKSKAVIDYPYIADYIDRIDVPSYFDEAVLAMVGFRF